jgi:uncharacterized protein (DUF433 family)
MIEGLRSWVGIDDPRDVPTYTLGDAARFLRMPPSTVRSWANGRSYKISRGTRHWDPLIDSAQVMPTALLSFLNLVELHVLRGMRTRGVGVPEIRAALDFVTGKLAISRPLIHIEFQTDGVHLLLEHLGRIVSVSERGQQILRGVLDAHLERIERDEQGLARRLFPFVRDPDHLDDPMNVMIDPCFAFGRPALRESGTTTRALLERYMAGESAADLAKDYGRTIVEIEDALRSEYGPIAA